MAESRRKPIEGVQFPLDAKGKRSTTGVAKRCWVAAMGDADPSFAKDVDAERNWRQNYSKYALRVANASVKSKAAALVQAKAGLAEAYKEFEFHRDGKAMSIADAMQNLPGSFHTEQVTGSGEVRPLTVMCDGSELRGEDVVKKMQSLVDAGSCEASVASTLGALVQHPEWSGAALEKYVFVILGATSEMGTNFPFSSSP